MVHVIDMGITGVVGVAFGGPNRDILFVTVSGNVINTDTGAITPTREGGSSLYKIKGLNVIGQTTPSVKLSSNICSI